MNDFLTQIRAIETKWQQRWKKMNIFKASPDNKKPKWFFTVPYPYASGPLHIGHCRTYTLGDIIARYKRHQGFNVLFPMAWHITGTPILAVSSRIKQNDPEIWKRYRDYVQIYETNQSQVDAIIRSFEDPMKCAMYFAGKLMEDFNRMGFSIDTTRQFTTADSIYTQFIRWQYQKLMDKGYITKGNYPILWCSKCSNAVGEDDILGGDEEKVELHELYAVKFRLKEEDQNKKLLAATLRPETIYGATNIWIHPTEQYADIKHKDEILVVSKKSIPKLIQQGWKIKQTASYPGSKLIGKKVQIPGKISSIPILPADFVKTSHATGIVYSVPAHAPYDYVALKDIQQDPNINDKYDLNLDEIQQIKPISIIKVEGMSEFPAIEVCKDMNIQDQYETAALEQATQKVYKAEYYTGKMKSNTGSYQNLTVAEAKTQAQQDMIANNQALLVYEPSRQAKCRCGTPISVAIIEDQYFLNYGDPTWKAQAFKALDGMEIKPEKYRNTFDHSLNWLDKRPCVRKRGLGTEFPFTPGKGWIIESLSDSVIYMAFYTIANIIRQSKIQAPQLIPQVFDWVFLNEGEITTVEEQSGISPQILKKMQREFRYWYPNDLRHTAIAHISNHLSFAIYHHVAIFPEQFWIQGYSLNDLLIREGQKMGKSKGNVIPISKIPEKYSVDLARLHLSAIATADSIIDWREEEVQKSLKKLKQFWSIAQAVLSQTDIIPNKWQFFSQIYIAQARSNIIQAKDYMSDYNIREYVQRIFYNNLNVIEEVNKNEDIIGKLESNGLIKQIIHWMVSYMTPIIPHICEEINKRYNILASEKPISICNFLEIEFSNQDAMLIDQKHFIDRILDDVEQICKVIQIKPRKIFFYLTPIWKQHLYELIQHNFEKKRLAMGPIMKLAKDDTRLKPYLKEVAKETRFLMRNPSNVYQNLIPRSQQRSALQHAQFMIKHQYKDVQVEIIDTDQSKKHDPAKKASKARPMKPAIYIE